MKKRIFGISATLILLLFTSCHSIMDIQPLDKITGEQLFSDVAGLKTVLANVYNNLPIEDFDFEPRIGYNFHNEQNSDGGWSINQLTDHAIIHSLRGTQPGAEIVSFWAYSDLRQLNQFLETVRTVEGLKDEERARLEAEGHFALAYMYFAMVRRYGGVPIITEVQKAPTTPEEEQALRVPRSTEKDTWDFVLSECDLAIAGLPEKCNSSDGALRATKWAAYALKSRAALHAASVAKYWDKAPLIGEAVDAKLVGGMTLADANNYYKQCIDASKAIIDNSGKTLYKPNPSTVEEAAKNFQTMFEDPSKADEEVIFKKAYIDGTTSQRQGHSTDYMFNPNQTKIGNYYVSGRYSVTLNIVDLFEDYTDDGTGNHTGIKTRSDGVEDEFATKAADFDVSKPYIHYKTQYDVFKDMDARLLASVIVPGSTWKNTVINMQGGLITSDGKRMMFTDGSAKGLDGKEYYAYGAPSLNACSGFGNLGQESENFSISGFSLKKFLQEAKNVSGNFNSSTQDFIDFRLGEIYLNYAEAAIESGQGDAALAKTYLNALRKRAGHKDEIPATLDNILKERQVELAFEGQRYWDLIRRRDYHQVFNSSYRKILVPVLDLRENPPQYIFVRANSYLDVDAGGRTFNPRTYYLSIPGVATNKLIQNPGY